MKRINEQFNTREKFGKFGGVGRSSSAASVINGLQTVIKIGNQLGFETSYDIGNMPRTDLFSVTELIPSAGLIYLRPVNPHLAFCVVRDAVIHGGAGNAVEIPKHFDRYKGITLRLPDFEKVFFLPGSNLLQKYFESPDDIQELFDAGWHVKLHPLTSQINADQIMNMGGNRVIGGGISAARVLHNAEKIGCCNNSEIGLIATLQNKNRSIRASENEASAYAAIYQLLDIAQDPKTVLEQMISSEYSGVFDVNDTKLSEKIGEYFQYNQDNFKFSVTI